MADSFRRANARRISLVDCVLVAEAERQETHGEAQKNATEHGGVNDGN